MPLDPELELRWHLQQRMTGVLGVLAGPFDGVEIEEELEEESSLVCWFSVWRGRGLGRCTEYAAAVCN